MAGVGLHRGRGGRLRRLSGGACRFFFCFFRFFCVFYRGIDTDDHNLMTLFTAGNNDGGSMPRSLTFFAFFFLQCR